jgi:hypothetical protein
MDKHKLLFVLGNPRSGTSLFRLMLTSHPDICVPPECGFIQWWFDKYFNWTINDVKRKERIDEFLYDISLSKKIETWKLDFNQLRQLIEQKKPLNYAQIVQCVILQYALNSKGHEPIYLGDKNNYYVNHLDFLAEHFPDAHYLVITRDGRDVACSYKDVAKLKTESVYKPKLASDVAVIAREWVKNNEQLIQFNHKAKMSLFLRYEDLVSSPETELGKVCEFLEIPFTNEMLNYYKRNAELELEPTQLLDWKKKTLEQPDATHVSRYKSILSHTEIEVFNSIANITLNKLGYV